MLELVKIIDKKLFIFGLLNSVTYFFNVIFYRKLYVLASSINKDLILENFYKESINIILLILLFEIIHRLIYYVTIKNINNMITKIFMKSANNIIKSKIIKIDKYDKENILLFNDLIYVYENVLTNIIILLPKNIIYILYYTYNIYTFSFKITIIMILISCISIYLFNYFSLYKNKNYEIFYKLDNYNKKKHIERINNLKHIKMCCMENYEGENINKVYNERKNLKNINVKLNNFINGIPDITRNIMIYTMYIMGAKYVKLDKIKPIELIFLGSNSSNFIYFIISIKNIYDNYVKHYFQLKIVLELLNNDNSNNNNSNKNNIKIEKLDIMYKNKLETLITIPYGKITAIIGKNGCGKTHLIYSLLKFNDDKKWSFKFNPSIENKNIRQYTSLIFQDALLFDETIHYNVTYNNLQYKYTDKYVYNMAEKIGLKEWLIKNRDRKIGLSGEKLSGGEKKKIQILNSLLQDKCIYIFDEPTNNLDKQTKKLCIKYINMLAQENKIVLVITHDIELINNSDLVINLEKSKI
jgi:ABC-type bacteriocin/lantibiotic exporter with double-glycine peptidase domain